MNFVQKIYYNDKPLILTTDSEAYMISDPAAEEYEFFSGGTLRSYTHALSHMDRPGIKGAIIEDISEATLLEQLHAMYMPLDAAGGIAYNEHNEVLLIFRRGKWDLPKGKLDAGENIEECALREVSEETGLVHLTLGEKICDTYHIYEQKGQEYLKRTAWYKMKGAATDKLMPQKEENIMEAKWVSEKDLAPYTARTYEAIRHVLRIAGLHW